MSLPAAAEPQAIRVSAPMAQSPVESPTATPMDLLVAAAAETQVRVIADGTVAFDARFAAGERRHFSASDGFEVTAGDSSAVLLELNGRTVPPLGAPGSSGTIVLTAKGTRQESGGNTPQ